MNSLYPPTASVRDWCTQLHRIDIEKTGLLFFDILNGYYHLANAAAKERKKPMVDNAVGLMKAARKTGVPIFFAQGSHREDESYYGLDEHRHQYSVEALARRHRDWGQTQHGGGQGQL